MDNFTWWRDGVIYQIYPRSFADGNQDGIGDLPGITDHLDYLADLGVNAIWLSPFYPTPDKDFGYDISDYCNVDPRFGTLADFDRLVEEAHKRDIHVIADLVLNHTSDRHPWFLESRSSRDNPRADWYIWQDKIPNNWQAVFGGPAWTFVPERGQYYYHMFLPEQPDVNWRNPEVRKAILDVVRFWLERGVDGFRLDVFNVYFKDDQFRSNPSAWGIRPFDRQKHIYDTDRPELVPLLKELRALLDSYPERYAVGETFISTPEKIIQYSGEDRLHAAFNFEFTHTTFNPTRLLARILDWERVDREHNIWPTYVLSNHDVPRPASRHGFGEDDARVKVMMALLLTQRGTPFLYYGEELGMRDISLKRDEILDPPGKLYWPFYKGRDGCRSPMQWNAEANAGFSTVKPWLPVHPNYVQRNVEAQRADPKSVFNLTRALLHLRKEYTALRRGAFLPVDSASQDHLSYLRRSEGETLLVTLNFKNRPTRVNLPSDLHGGTWLVLFSTHRAEPDLLNGLVLQPYEVCVMRRL